MKKFLCLIAFAFVSIAGIFAAPSESLIAAAKRGDYNTFEQLVKKGASLNEVSSSGLTLQCALAYFSDEDFEKACKLLNKKKFDFNKPTNEGITLAYLLAYSYSYEKLKTLLTYKPVLDLKTDENDVTPISATQFGTFKFYSGQKVDMANFDKAESVRELLIENGSPEFEVLPLSIYYFGNFQYCFISVVKGMFPFLFFLYFNTEDMFEFSEVNGQQWAAVSKEKLKWIMNDCGLDGTIREYTDPESICDEIKNVIESDHGYIVIAQTGNNPLCPFQWVTVKNAEGFDPESKLKVFCPDSHYEFMEYQIKDISMLVTIQID